MKRALVFIIMAATACGTDGGTKDGTTLPDTTDPLPEPTDGASCVPGLVYCNGPMAMTCRADGKDFESFVNCADQGKGCTTGKGCTVCTPGLGSCDGNVAKRCNADGSGWDTLGDCGAGSVCQAGSCVNLCAQAESSASYIGCEYTAVTTINSQLAVEFEFAVAVANPQDVEATVTVTDGGGYNANFTVAPKALEIRTLPYVQALKQTFPQEASVQVAAGAYTLLSSVPVTVYQFNPLEYMVNGNCSGYDPDPLDGKCYSYTNDASLLLPRHVLTGNYFVMARPTMSTKRLTGAPVGSPGFFAVAGVTDEPAAVTVVFNGKTTASADGSIRAFEKGETGTFTLAKNEVLQITSALPSTCYSPDSDGSGYTYCNNGAAYDLSGTRVSADHPVAAFSGHNCTFVPFNRWACDHLEEQLFPLETWGKEFVVTRTIPMFADNPEPNVYKVLSGKDGNLVGFDPPSVHPAFTLNAGEYGEFETRESFTVTGTEGLLVAQFMVGMNYFGYTNPAPSGDPAMSLAVPAEQYRDAYTFLAPLTYEKSYVNITAAAATAPTILLDGMAPGTSWTPLGGSGFVTTTVDVVGGTHAITGGEVFGIIVYGTGDYTSYMYPGGLDLEKILVI